MHTEPERPLRARHRRWKQAEARGAIAKEPRETGHPHPRGGHRDHLLAFDTLISTDAVRTFKPDPRAYALGPRRLGLPPEELVFAAFGGWDAAGATWFGFPTFWVNRLSVTPEQLTPPPTLRELAEFVAQGDGPRSG